MSILILSLSIFLSPNLTLAQSQPAHQKSYEDWLRDNPIDEDGKLREDALTRFPEISTMFLINKDGDVKPAIGVEIFHNRSRPRKHRTKWELHLADQEIGIGFSRIIVPVVNFTFGPYYAYDVKDNRRTYGIRFGIFKF